MPVIALSASILPYPTLLLGHGLMVQVAVVNNVRFTAAGVRVEFLLSNSATVPDTTGVAIDVPERVL